MAKFLLCFFTIFVFVLSTAADTSEHYCGWIDSFQINTSSSNRHILGLSTLQKQYYRRTCCWEIDHPTSGSYLSLDDAKINSNDSLTITGIRSGTSFTIFHTKDRIYQAGKLSLAGYDQVTVTLTLEPSATSSADLEMNDPRSFYVLYYNSSAIRIHHFAGRQLTFPLNMDANPIYDKLELQTGEGIKGQLIMLNFTQLPQNASSKVTVDGVPLTSTSSSEMMATSSPTMFLQSHDSPTITIILDMQQPEPISFRYWFVNGSCSEKKVLEIGQKARTILYLNETERLKVASSPVRCAMHYTTEYQFVIHMPTLTGIADSADSVYFYNGKGQVVLGQNNLEGLFSASGNGSTLINSDTVVVIYESPYVVSPNADFQAPQIMAVPKQMNQTSHRKVSPVKSVKSVREWCGRQILTSTGDDEQLRISVKFESLAVSSSADNYDSRTSYALYPNNQTIRLLQSIGQVTFPLNGDKTPISGAVLKFKPGVHFDDQLILLNFTQLPVNASSKVTVDGAPLTSTSPTMFLQFHLAPTITITLDMPHPEPITFRYWLVSKRCSKIEWLLYGEGARPILHLNETERLKLASSPVRCAMRYITEPGYQFGIHLPSPTATADPADTMYFYDEKGRVALEFNNLAGVYGRSEANSLIETNTAVVLYESPYIAYSDLNFKVPQIKAILTQVHQINLNKDTSVKLKFSPDENTVQLIMSKEDFVKNVELALPSVASLRTLEASPRVPIASLFEYINQITLVNEAKIKLVEDKPAEKESCSTTTPKQLFQMKEEVFIL